MALRARARKAGRDWTVFVDPYTAEVLGHRDNRHYLPSIALDIHGSLPTSRFMDEDGTWGDRLIELAASWAIVLGAPRRAPSRKVGAGVAAISLRRKERRPDARCR
jgi:uncharacterized iron-regulated membrane protein